MSTALLKKSLELADTESIQKREVIKGKKKQKKIYSELRFKNKPRKVKNNRSVADVKPGNLNSVDKSRKQLIKKDSKEDINKKLKLLHRPPNKKIVNQILEHLGYGDKKKENSKKEHKTAFTEEDFLKFEREYVDTD